MFILLDPPFHLEDPEVATRTFSAVRRNVLLVVEQNRGRAFGLEADRAPADQKLRNRAGRQQKAEQGRKNDALLYFFTREHPPSQSAVLSRGNTKCKF
jgi:hypothetical protein